MKKYLHVLLKSDLFRNIDGDLEEVLACLDASLKSYEPDTVLIHSGTPVASIGIVVSGSGMVVKEDIDGNRVIIGNIMEGGMFGEALACAGIKKSPVTVITITGCKVIFINVSRIITTCGSNCAHHVQIIKNLLEIMSFKNLFLNSRIDILTQKTLRDKLVAFLNMEMGKAGSNKFDISFSREELADFLFANRSAISRELCLMRDEGLIKFEKNRFEILQRTSR